jgi:hypothetical protein
MPVPNNKEPTWDDAGAIAEAIVALTKHADLPHDMLVELALPAIRRLALVGDQLSTDPHGDGMAAEVDELDSVRRYCPKTWHEYTAEETKAALSNLSGTQMQAALLDALGCCKNGEATTAELDAAAGVGDVEKTWYALSCLEYLDRHPSIDLGELTSEAISETVWSKPEGYPEDYTDEEYAALRIAEATRLNRVDLVTYWAEWLVEQGQDGE